MSEPLPTAEMIEADAKRVGLTIAELCRRTRSAPTTFYRWKSGKASPTLGTVADWLGAIAQEEAGHAREVA